MNTISNEDLVSLLGLPPEFADRANQIMVPANNSGLVVKSTYQREFKSGKVVDTLLSRTFAPKTALGKSSHTLLNFMSDKINQEMFVQVGVDEFEEPGKNDETGFRNASSITIKDGVVKLGDKGVFMNIESTAKQGSIGDTDGKFTGEEIQYKDGWNSFEHHKTINVVTVTSRTRVAGTGPLYGTEQQWKVITRTTQSFEKSTIVLTKSDIEALGFTDQMLASMAYQSWILAEGNPVTTLTSVACELQPVSDTGDLFFPQVWINGRDDNEFNFRNLMTPWGFKACDFDLKITAWGDLTVEDIFHIDGFGRTTLREDSPVFATSENPTMLGVGGKFVERRFANETPPLIRVSEGGAYRSHVDEEGVLNIQFKAGDERKKLGMHIAWLPDTGKSDFYHVWLDLKTGEHTPNMWRV